MRTLLALLIAASAMAADACWKLTLAEALASGDGRPQAMELRVLVRDGAVVAAAGEAPTLTKAQFLIDAADLRIGADGAWSGTIGVAIPSDGWVPPTGTTWEGRFAIDGRAEASAIAGSWRGGIAGRGESLGNLRGERIDPPAAAVWAIELACAETLRFPPAKPGKPGQADATTLCIALAPADGAVAAVRLIPRGSPTDTAYGLRALRHDLVLRDGRLAGGCDVAVHHQDGRREELRIAVDARVFGDALIGATACSTGGAEVGRGTCRGAIRDGAPPPPDDLVGEMVLHDAIGIGKYARVFLARRAGAWTAAFATTPNYNNATHEAAIRDLAFADGRLRGGLDLTIHCDPWIPADRQIRTVPVQVDLELRGAELVGTFALTYDGAPIAGAADGVLSPRSAIGPSFRATVKMEEAVGGGNAWLGRVFVSGEIADGRWVAGKPWNNHNKAMTGSVGDGTLAIADDRMRGSWLLTLAPGAGVEAGAYRVSIDGPAVGGLAAGTFRVARADGGAERSGRFWASASPR